MNILENKSLFIEQAASLVSGEENLVTNLSNLSALYKEYLPNTNWVGFYLVDNKTITLYLVHFKVKLLALEYHSIKVSAVIVTLLHKQLT